MVLTLLGLYQAFLVWPSVVPEVATLEVHSDLKAKTLGKRGVEKHDGAGRRHSWSICEESGEAMVLKNSEEEVMSVSRSCRQYVYNLTMFDREKHEKKLLHRAMIT